MTLYTKGCKKNRQNTIVNFMNEYHSENVPARAIFFKKVMRSFLVGIGLAFCSLMLGIWGYRYFEEMSWVDAYLNASMILSGMGPADTLKTTSGKIFAGSYALFSGIVFLIVMAIIFAPICHRFFRKIHLETQK